MNLLDQFESELATYCKYRLANGMTVIIAQRPHTRTFGMCMEMNVGMGALHWNACEDRLLPPSAIKEITLELSPERVSNVAKRFFSPENRYWLLSGGFGPMGYFKVKRMALK